MLKVSSLVEYPRINSTSCMTGTGFIKCIPTNLSARTPADNSVIEIEDVFEAIIDSGLSRLSNSMNILILSSLFSLTASMIRSVSESIFLRPTILEILDNVSSFT